MPDNYFVRYLPLLVHLLVACGVAGGMIALSTLLGHRKPSKFKQQPYECGMTPTGDTRGRFSVKFYLVAMLFILFDIEAVFLYPWAVVYRELGMFGFVEMLLFMVLVLSGFYFVWKKGALDWTVSPHRKAHLIEKQSKPQ